MEHYEKHQCDSECKEEKNYFLYDESYLSPGFFVINENKEGKIQKWFKIYNVTIETFTSYAIRAFSVDKSDNLDEEFNTINFTFRKIEDHESGLYETFNNLCLRLNGSKVETFDKCSQGRNNFYLTENGGIVTFSISKDTYGVKDSSDFIDVRIGEPHKDEKNFIEISRFYSDLIGHYSSKTHKATEEFVQQLLLTRLK